MVEGQSSRGRGPAGRRSERPEGTFQSGSRFSRGESAPSDPRVASQGSRARGDLPTGRPSARDRQRPRTATPRHASAGAQDQAQDQAQASGGTRVQRESQGRDGGRSQAQARPQVQARPPTQGDVPTQRRAQPSTQEGGNPYLDAEAQGPRRRRGDAGAAGDARSRGGHYYQGAEGTRTAGPGLERPIITNRAQGFTSARPQRQRKRSKAGIVAAVLIIIGLAAGVTWYLWANMKFDITVNGQTVQVKQGTTVTDLVTEGYANPAPGDLLAIDGSMLTEGGGDPFSATVNGSAAVAGYTLSAGNVVEIGDGADATEEVVTEQVTIPAADAEQTESFGAIHRYVEGSDGVLEKKTGKVSGKVQETVVTEPVAGVAGGYIEYNVDTGDDKVVALTFDDGPWDTTTQQILDILAENGAHATFFTIGNQISSHASLVKEAVEQGNEVLTHTWDHADGSGQGVNLTYMSAEEQVSEVQRGMSAIEEATGTAPANIIRAPGGNFYGELVTTLQPYISADIGWNIDTEDWTIPGVDAIVAAIESAQPGDVILMHDGGGDRSQTVEALSIALPYLKEQGFSFVTISELLEYPVKPSTY